LQHVSAGLSGRSGGMPILRLLRDGVFAYGQEDIEPQEGSQWAVNPFSFQHGFACWGSEKTSTQGQLLGEAMVPLNQPPPDVNELQNHGEPWAQQISFQLQCLNGEDTGVTVIYKSTSIGYLNMAKGLIDQIVLQLQHDKDNCVPVVELDAGHYHHKDYGKTYFPVIDPVRWISVEGEQAAKAETPAVEDDGTPVDKTAELKEKPEPEKKPAAKRRGRAKAVEPEAEASEVDAVTAEMEGKDEPAAQPAKSGRRRRRAV
jgi:hypothetical protein